VVAAGVWADRIEQMAAPAAPDRLRPSKGVHLLFRRRDLSIGETAALIPDGDGRRMLTVIPWLESVLVGTTDTPFSGDIDHPSVDPADRAYVLDAVNSTFDVDLGEDDITGAFAGLRPLIAGKAGPTADLSRRHRVYDLSAGVVGITGGKLTTWRRMAADAVDRVAKEVGCTVRSSTRSIHLGSSDRSALELAVARRAGALGIPKEAVANLVRCYGDRAMSVLDIASAEDMRETLVEDHPQIAAEASYCARGEMVVHLGDFLARRTRLSLTDSAAGCGRGSRAPELIAREMGWKEQLLSDEIVAYRRDISYERGLPVSEEPPAEPRDALSAGS
jgi:glycerol-3-phosphate dehydrogenase